MKKEVVQAAFVVKNNPIKTAMTVVGLITTIASAIWMFESRMETLIAEQVKITAEIFANDVRTRIIVLELEIQEYTNKNRPVPERLPIHKRLMENQLEKLKEKWN